ncbi:hypothetical protein A3860_29960 [Niastella vici]|uniref:DUF8202 domain-containing protein n=1 Tax=Niastella vici TaxID=1703345 RepID=A0A1V9FU98_9BACT|nr:T9SS type A sorting domain-containing protein [Niastella vici]OQP61923.1 hypothetical protein A3860_29960 [Niastella vici]
MATLKTGSLLGMLWAITCTALCQSPSPGGIHGAIQWYSTDTGITTPGLRSRLPGDTGLLTFDKATTASLNFHPALVFTGANAINVNLAGHDLCSASYFTVYQSLDTAHENNIWHLSSDTRTGLVLTTNRMADLSAYQYMNYIDVVRAQPKVNVYVQNKEKDSLDTGMYSWTIGMKPTAPQLPVVNFRGYVPEVIAYNRALNSQERLQVASYLALKYGITLTEPGATYLNSAGETIWSGYDYPQWHHNIAAIGRDDSAALYQVKATSSNHPGLLTVSTADQLNNNSFLLWGDNGKPLTPAPKIAGLPVMLQTTWLMKSYGNVRAFTTDVVIDTKPVDAPLPVQPVYWLAIDRTGKGSFNMPGVEFVKMEKLDPQGKAYFRNLVWNKDSSGKAVWAVIAAQDLLLATTIQQPTCTQPRAGGLQVKILGGQSPFLLQVRNTGGLSTSKNISNSTVPVTIAGLAAGKYFLVVTDAAQHIYRDSFYLNNDDVPVPTALAASYELPAGRPLTINAADNMPNGLLWEWSGPNGFQSFNPQVTITEPGLYTVRCSTNGCGSQQDLKVTAAPNNMLSDVTVYPNPSPAAFNARVTLPKPAPVTMSVYAPDGRLITTQKGDNRSNYLFTGDLKSAGVYELVFTSGQSQTSKRLVIAK